MKLEHLNSFPFFYVYRSRAGLRRNAFRRRQDLILTQQHNSTQHQNQVAGKIGGKLSNPPKFSPSLWTRRSRPSRSRDLWPNHAADLALGGLVGARATRRQLVAQIDNEVVVRLELREITVTYFYAN